MAWDQQQLATPPREFLSPNGQIAGGRGQSKADKILGTTTFAIPQHEYNTWGEGKRGARSNFLRTPETVSRKPSSFVPAPTPSPDHPLSPLSPQHLRVRASSPLLGHKYEQQNPLPGPRKLRKEIRQTGSSSTLYSYFNPRDSTAVPIVQSEPVIKANGSRGKDSAETQSKAGQSIKPKEQKNSAKEYKRKIRPPRIDLTLLFPKPRPTTAPLLSPHRMMSSPSQTSLATEASPPNANRSDGRRPTTSQLVPPTSRRPSEHDLSEASDKENNKRLGPSLERTVRTSEFDLALDKYDELQRRQSRSTERTLGTKASRTSAGGWSKHLYLSPDRRPSHLSNRVSHSAGTLSGERRERSGSDIRPISKNSSKSTLQASDLHASSVLCLSSSEDEDEEVGELAQRQFNPKNRPRDSVATYDESETEICTASAAHATRAPALKRVGRTISTNNRSRHMYSAQSTSRNPSTSSAGRSSYATRKSHSRRSSGAPMTTGSDTHQSNRHSQQGNQILSPRELRRRSRVMAVTRQEEHLLQAMREREGKVTPSLFHALSPDPEQQSMLSGPLRDSFHSADMSFLRLSSGPPPLEPDRTATNSDNGPTSQPTNPDTERKTIYSTASARASLVYSESLPSTTASAASPLTPTLPIHRFSPLPANKLAPRQPPAPVPQDQMRHSRRRTDSSEAIVLGEADDSKGQEEFPVWALGLDHGRAITSIH